MYLSSVRLEELCGLSVSDTTIREIAQETGAKMLAWPRTARDAVRDFRAATGDVEFTTDGTSVNTTEGWREMKLGIFSKRERGQPATPDEWGDRVLPKPHTCVAFAAIEASDPFGARWKAWAKRLEIRDLSALTVLADGAKWIWEEARLNLTGSRGVLDVYHALQPTSDTSQKLFGEGTPAATTWTEALRTTLLERGWEGFDECWRDTRVTYPTDAPQQARLDDLRNYLGHHVSHLNYAERLQEGRSIGSGQIEGAGKNLIGRRLKQTARPLASPPRPTLPRVCARRMVGLCSIMYSHQWNAYGNQQAA